MTKVFVVRHAEREDHINEEWQNSSHRTHDAPLSLHGLEQAQECGQRLLKQLEGLEGKHVVFLVSPLQRCVQTAREIMVQLEVAESHAMRIEQAFCEGNAFLRNRMFGTHRNMSTTNSLTGKPRTMKRPVLLGPGDLISVAAPVKIDFSHKIIHRVKYTNQCYEICEHTQEKSLLESIKAFVIPHSGILHTSERMKAVVPKFKAWLAEVEEKAAHPGDLVVVVVTHGAVGSTFTNALVEKDEGIKFQYCTTVEIAKQEGGSFQLQDVWNLPEIEDAKVELA